MARTHARASVSKRNMRHQLIQMPGSIDGLKLAHLISVRWPKVKIIVTSGRLRLREDDMPAGGRYLHKPYDPSQLIGILEDWATSE